MSKKVLRTALIGAGNMGRGFHLYHLLRHEEYELVAIVDPVDESLEKCGEIFEQYGKTPEESSALLKELCYNSLEKMLEEKKPDLCVIVSPTPLHCAQAVTCMEYGSDVFLEKPMGMDLKESKWLYERKNELGKKLMIYQPHRACPETQAAEQIIESGKLGKIFMIKREFSEYYLRDHWQGYKKNGGGNLANHGAHYIDQMLHLAGGSVVKACAVLKPLITTGDADDFAKAVFYTDTDVTLDLDINFVSAYPVNSMAIYGINGEAVLKEDGFHIKYYDPAIGGTKRDFPFVEEELHCFRDIKPIDIYQKCYEFYALDEPPFVTVEETLKVMAALDMARADSGEY